MALVENDRIVSDDNEVVNIINDYHSCLLENLKLQVPKSLSIVPAKVTIRFLRPFSNINITLL